MILPESRQMAIDLIEESCDAGARIAPACEILGLTCRTLRRWKEQLKTQNSLEDGRQDVAQRPAPANKLRPEEVERILEVANSPEYASLPPTQIVPRLADGGVYIASESSFYRVLKVHGQNNRRGKAHKPKLVPKPQGFKATASNQVWSWDITFLASQVKGMFYRAYVVEDVYSRHLVGWEIHETESSEHASTLIQKACLAHGVKADSLVLHSDNGSPMKGATLLATLQRLGVVPSFSRPSVSDDNPYSESLFRTLKYCPTYPAKPFESLEHARKWMHGFVVWYNHHHRHSGIRYVTPAQRHAGQDKAILAARHGVYQTARSRNPNRWSGNTRNWNHIGEVWLNPPKEHSVERDLTRKAA